MKVINKKFNSMMGNEIRQPMDKVTYLEACLKQIFSATKLIESILEFNRGQKEFDNAITVVLDADEFLSVDTGKVEEIRDRFLPSTPALYRRLTTFLGLTEEVSKIMSSNIELMVPFTQDQIDEIFRYLSEACGHLACYTYYEFGFSDLIGVDSIEEIYDVLDNYAKVHNNSIEQLQQLAKDLNKLLNLYTPKMGVFERYPEMLEPFSNLVGADLYDCVNLDLKTIKGVVDGTIPLDKFQEDLERLLEKEDEEG